MASAEMQLYLSTPVDSHDLVEALADLLGMKVESLEWPNDDAEAFLMTRTYVHGFPLGINVSWRPELEPRHDQIAVARGLAQRYGIRVATDLPEQNPRHIDPYRWCVAEPDGSVAEVWEDTTAIPGSGLVLDEATKKPLQGWRSGMATALAEARSAADEQGHGPLGTSAGVPVTGRPRG